MNYNSLTMKTTFKKHLYCSFIIFFLVFDFLPLENESLFSDTMRTIEFSGYTWYVKNSKNCIGPGPNYFTDSKDAVWVDEHGRLHLTIKKNKNRWYCTEVFTQKFLGYGEYTFVIASPIDNLDIYAVLGFFTWDETAPEKNYREIDIEFARWGIAEGPNVHYSVQPWEFEGNHKKFSLTIKKTYSKHQFSWTSKKIQFISQESDNNSQADWKTIASWEYTGTDLPPPGPVQARINLWLMNGKAPVDQKSIEVIIDSFNYLQY